MLRQPVLVYEAERRQARPRSRAARASARCRSRSTPAELFATGRDDDNRAAVAAVATDDLDLVGVAPARAAQGRPTRSLRGLKRHP